MSQHNARAPKKQAFLQGAAILAIGALLAKIIGAMFKIPLARMITPEGAGHFNVAYNIYIVLLNVSSSGLPIAVSRLIAEANTLGQHRQVRQIQRVSIRLFLLIGALCSVAMLIFSSQLASWMRDPDAKYAIAILAPAVLFVCISSAFRGYFQGQQYMTPTAVAQVMESLCKLLIGLLAAALALRVGMSIPQAAGMAILGVTIGAALSSVYLFLQYRNKRASLPHGKAAEQVPSAIGTAGNILKLAAPITLGATGLQIINAFGSKIILGRLQDAIGLTSVAASSLFGVYSMAQTLYLLPSAFVQPLTVSIVPAVTEALALNHRTAARNTEEAAIRMAGLIALPCGLGLSVLSKPIQRLLYDYDSSTLETAGVILTLLGVSAILYCFVLVTNSILQAHGKVNVPLFSTLVGGVANILTNYFLVGDPRFHIYGAAVGTIVYCVAAVLLNLLMIRRLIPDPPRFFSLLIKPICAAVIMAITAFLGYKFTHNTVLCIGFAGAVYLALVYMLKILTWHDCQLLPKGALIARLLRIKPPADEN